MVSIYKTLAPLRALPILTISSHAKEQKEKFVVYANRIYFCVKLTNMKNLSLKLEDNIFEETEKIITKVHKSRNRYINEALEFYNKLQKRRLLARQLEKESKLVAEESLSVLAEFEALEDEG